MNQATPHTYGACESQTGPKTLPASPPAWQSILICSLTAACDSVARACRQNFVATNRVCEWTTVPKPLPRATLSDKSEYDIRFQS